MVQTTADELNPPDKQVPIGTSLRILKCDGILKELMKVLHALGLVLRQRW